MSCYHCSHISNWNPCKPTPVWKPSWSQLYISYMRAEEVPITIQPQSPNSPLFLCQIMEVCKKRSTTSRLSRETAALNIQHYMPHHPEVPQQEFNTRTIPWNQIVSLLPVEHSGLLFSTYSNTQLCWLRTSMEARNTKKRCYRSTGYTKKRLEEPSV